MKKGYMPLSNRIDGTITSVWNSQGFVPLPSPSLGERVADAIVEGIASGFLIPGQRLVEADIANQMLVSRVPVREAVKILETQGIVTRTPYRGVHIAEINEDKVKKILEVRVVLEKIAFREASVSSARNPEMLENLDEIIEYMVERSEHQDWNGVNRADIAFHRAVCVASNNEIVITFWEALARYLRIIFQEEFLSKGDPLAVVQEHRILRDGIERQDQRFLDKEIEYHIKQVRFPEIFSK